MAFKPRKDECGFLGCSDLHTAKSYLCAVHQEVLRPVKEAMEAEEDPYGTRNKGGTPRPQCTRPGCRNPRKHGQSICADCAEAAFWDGTEGAED